MMELHPTINLIDWNASKEYAKNNIRDIEKQKCAVESVETIRSVLGEDLLQILKSHKNSYLWNFTFILIWSADEVIAFSQKLNNLRYAQNFDKLIAKLMNPKDDNTFNEFMTIIDTAEFLSRNFEIVFSPKIIDFKKLPDMKIIDRISGCEVYVEVSELQKSTESNDLSFMISSIVNFGHEHNISIHGRFGKYLNENEANRVFDEIKYLLASNSLHPHFYENATLEITIVINNFASANDAKLLCNDHGIEYNTIVGPPYTKNEWRRFSRKFSEEKIQLKPGCNNIVVIWASDAMIENRFKPTDMAKRIERALQREHHIDGIIAISKFPNNSFYMNDSNALTVFKDAYGSIFYMHSQYRSENSVSKRIRSCFPSHQKHLNPSEAANVTTECH